MCGWRRGSERQQAATASMGEPPKTHIVQGTGGMRMALATYLVQLVSYHFG